MNHLIPSYAAQVAFKDFKEYKFLPINFHTSRCFSFWIDGIFENIKPLELESPELHFFTDLLGKNFRLLVEEFDKEYIFSEPEIIFKPAYLGENDKIGMKVRILEREVYEEIVKKK